MNQTNQVANIGMPSEAPVKRKRGRPRKDETQAMAAERASPTINRPPLRPMVTRMMVGEGSSAAKPTPSFASKGKDQMEVDVDLATAYDHHNKDEMVGQVVIGVLECAFDAGYFLRVRVGDTNVHLRGVVFKEGSVVPVTPENDIAPNAKMYKKSDMPIPVAFSPQVQVPRCIGDSPSKPVQINEGQQMQPPPQPVESVPQREDHSLIPPGHSEQQGQSTIPLNTGQEKSLIDKEPSIVLEQEEEQNRKEVVIADQGPVLKQPVDDDGGEKETKTELPEDKMLVESRPKTVSEVGSELKQRQGLAIRDGLEVSPEPLLKSHETEQTTVGHSNGLPPKIVTSDDAKSVGEVPESVAKSDEASGTILPQEATNLAEPALNGKEPVVVPVVVEPETGGASGFQISMENTDNDEPDPLPEPSNEVSLMQTE